MILAFGVNAMHHGTVANRSEPVPHRCSSKKGMQGACSALRRLIPTHTSVLVPRLATSPALSYLPQHAKPSRAWTR